jgi:hypothetical protein
MYIKHNQWWIYFDAAVCEMSLALVISWWCHYQRLYSITGGQVVRKGFGRKWSWSKQDSSCICLEWLRKPMKNLRLAGAPARLSYKYIKKQTIITLYVLTLSVPCSSPRPSFLHNSIQKIQFYSLLTSALTLHSHLHFVCCSTVTYFFPL